MTGSDEHLHGFSSLALLAGLKRHTRILYLLSWPDAILALGRSADVEVASTTILVDGWTRLPFASASVDAIVVDLDAVPDLHRTRHFVALELERVLGRGGRCLAVVTHRRRPRDRRAWSRYRLVPPVFRWRKALNRTGLAQIDQAQLLFDGQRITNVRPRPESDRSALPDGAADAVALVLSDPESRDRSILDELSERLTRELGGEVALGRIHVRKIGKNAAFAKVGDSRIIVRLPRSSIAIARARRNDAALDAVHQSGTGIPVQAVPRPLARGAVGHQPYFVESVVPGEPREGRVREITWERQALEFITSLHAATARVKLLTDEWFQQAVEPALASVERSSTGIEDGTTIEWLRRTLRERLIGSHLVLVRSHGDFTGSNCLYDPGGRLSGVVDWELSSEDALPLLDLLQCVDLPSEYTEDGRWHRAEIVFDAIEGRGPLSDAPEIRAYLRRLGVSEELFVPLLLMHWVDHAGARVDVRKSDKRWFGRRVTAPLRRLRQLAGTNE